MTFTDYGSFFVYPMLQVKVQLVRHQFHSRNTGVPENGHLFPSSTSSCKGSAAMAPLALKDAMNLPAGMQVLFCSFHI